jgi:hypothetical protein
MDEEELEVLEQVEISDDEDDDFNYEGVDDLQFADDDEDEEDDDEEDLAAAMASVNMSPDKADSAGNPRNAKVKPVTQVRPSVVDDFIRNFLIKVDMKQTPARARSGRSTPTRCPTFTCATRSSTTRWTTCGSSWRRCARSPPRRRAPGTSSGKSATSTACTISAWCRKRAS